MSNTIYRSDLLVRDAKVNEWESVANLTRLAYQQYAVDADPNFWQLYEANTRQTLLSDTKITRVVVMQAEHMVASAIYCPPYEKLFGERLVKNPYPEMRLLAVSPAHRNQGLADLLINECERRAKESNADALTLHTTKLMTVAKSMYERRGYKRFEQIDFEPTSGFVVWGFIKELHNDRA